MNSFQKLMSTSLPTIKCPMNQTDLILTLNSKLIMLILIAIDLSILIGNILVIIAASTSKKLKRFKTNIFIINLAVSDLLLGVLVLPLSISNQISNRRWHFGDVFCNIWLVSDVLLCSASILNLTVISFDRYLAIRNPIRYMSWMTTRNSRILLSSVWVLSLIISFPAILTLITKNIITEAQTVDYSNSSAPVNCHTHPSCSITDSSSGYIIYSALGSYYIPLVVMVYFYTKIFATVHRTISGIAKGRLTNRDGKTIVMRIHCGGFESAGNKAKETEPNPSNATEHEPQLTATVSQRKSCFGFPCKFVFRKTDSERSIETETDSLDKSKCNVNHTEIVADSDYEFAKIHGDNLSVNLINDRARLTRVSENKIPRPQLSRMQREAKAARMLGVICGSFILCWLPFFMVYITGAFYKDIPIIWFDAVFWLGYCNSLLNPWIYAMFSKDFRLAYSRFLCRNRV